ncbi:unannotated protein [freshwater metagenome]|uniref:Unannotated protein n=1 Tax=freshwater metagenome TaxID=449393 RepID=A0A6J7P935_9ZZZZ
MTGSKHTDRVCSNPMLPSVVMAPVAMSAMPVGKADT